MPDEEFITVKEASRLSTLSVRQIQHLMKTGVLRGRKPARDWLVSRQAVVEYIKQERKPGPKSSKPRP